MAKGLLSAGTFTGTRKSWWQRVSSPPEPVSEPKNSWWRRVSLAPEPVDRNQQFTANHDGNGSLKRRNIYGNQEIMMAKGLFAAGTCIGTQELMMAKGLFSTGTCGPKPANHSKSWCQRVSLAPEPLPELGNHDGKGSLWRQNLYIPEPKKSWWRRVSLAPEPVDRNQQINANNDGRVSLNRRNQ